MLLHLYPSVQSKYCYKAYHAAVLILYYAIDKAFGIRIFIHIL